MTSLPVRAAFQAANESMKVLDVISHREQFDNLSCTTEFEVCELESINRDTH